MPDLYALTFAKVDNRMKLASVDQVTASDIADGDSRIFVAREANIDWLSEAVESHFNQGVSQ